MLSQKLIVHICLLSVKLNHPAVRATRKARLVSGLCGMMGRKGSPWPRLKGSREVSGVVAFLDSHLSEVISEVLVSSPLISAHFSLLFCLP